MDYCLETSIFHLEINKEFFSTILERMEEESKFINDSINNNFILLEADDNTNKNQGIWESIKAFFKRIFGMFSEKTKTLFDSNKKWMDDNFNKLDKINYDKLKISMLPFWLMSVDRIKNVVNRIQEIANNELNNPKNLEKFKDIEDMKSNLFRNYLNEDNDLTLGFKNKFRVNNPKGPIKVEELEGAELKSKAVEFKNYCYNYGKDILPVVQAWISKAEQSLNRVEKVLKESADFCLIENTLYCNTDLVHCSNFEVVFEADDSQNDNKKKDEKKPGDASTKPTEVSVVNKDNKEDVNAQEENKKYSNLNSTQLNMYKNIVQIIQLSITSAMTVLEERFRAYLNALKSIVAEGGKDTNNNPDEKK